MDPPVPRIAFAAVTPSPGEYICAEGRYLEGDGDSGPEKRAGIFVGPEFGTVIRPDLVAAAREAGDAGFDVLIACAFNYEAHASEFNHLGRIPVLKARMNADLHMAQELKNTGKGNLFVIFGEPDIDILPAGGDAADGGQLRVKIKAVDTSSTRTLVTSAATAPTALLVGSSTPTTWRVARESTPGSRGVEAGEVGTSHQTVLAPPAGGERSAHA